MSNQIEVVVGGQFGSEGKGAVCGWLAKQMGANLAAVRVAGPNAGHTVLDPLSLQPWRLRQVPVAAVTNRRADLYLAAGSEIDPPVLWDEVKRLVEAGYEPIDRMWVDRAATIITDEHKRAEEGLVKRIGSTGKGIGAARADRIWRRAEVVGGRGVDTVALLQHHLASHGPVLIEGTQGWGLGLHTPFYPKTTSSDCRAIDFLGMVGLSPWDPDVRGVSVWVVLRAHPIRVAGDSGPMLAETTWEALGQEPEFTTVTQKVRRVGLWDADLAAAAVKANGGATSKVVFTFLDYVFPATHGVRSWPELLRREPKVQEFLEQRELEIQAPIKAVGTGPATIVERP